MEKTIAERDLVSAAGRQLMSSAPLNQSLFNVRCAGPSTAEREASNSRYVKTQL